MSKDFGPSLDRELDTASPPTAITADGIIHKGRTQARSRRVYTGIASLVALALATGMVFQIARGATGAGPADTAGSGSPSASPEPSQPDFPLPDLGDEQEYLWAADDDGVPTEATKLLTQRWWDALSAVDDAEIVVYEQDGEPDTVAAERADFADFTRRAEYLAIDDAPGPGARQRGSSTGFVRPVYLGTERLLRFDGVPRPDNLEIAYYPKGSYIPGPKTPEGGSDSHADWRHLTAGCDDITFSAQNMDGWTADFTCEYSDGPHGERVLSIEVDSRGPAADYPFRYNRVVVYYPDGNAVVVSDYAPAAIVHGETSTSIPDPRPGLSTDELARMVFAMPPVIVS